MQFLQQGLDGKHILRCEAFDNNDERTATYIYYPIEKFELTLLNLLIAITSKTMYRILRMGKGLCYRFQCDIATNNMNYYCIGVETLESVNEAPEIIDAIQEVRDEVKETMQQMNETNYDDLKSLFEAKGYKTEKTLDEFRALYDDHLRDERQLCIQVQNEPSISMLTVKYD